MRRTIGLALLLHISLAAQSLDGVWRSQGYGDAFEIRGTTLQAFEVTARTCVRSFTARQSNTTAAGQEATFTTPDGDVFFVRTGGAHDHRLLHFDGAASDIRIDRLPRMPAVCEPPTADTSPGNFEVFTRTWAEHYISFDLKHVDWEKIVADNRPKVTPQTTPVQLFEILESMIKPFGDAHTFIHAQNPKLDFKGIRPGSNRAIADASGRSQKDRVPALFAVTERAYIHGTLSKFCNDQIAYGHIDDTTGYLRIRSFSGYSKVDYAAGLIALEAALDTIFSDPKLRALVIDVRINFGGADPYGLAIAARLASGGYLAYTKYARADGVDRNKWTAGDSSVVRPSSRPGFRGPVVELIGPLTISAGETFTQALMGRTPHIPRIGENTQGVFSDVLDRRMPNGWMFGLPNEVYRSAEGTAFDVRGIAPDVSVPVFAEEDVAAGKDPGMAKALEILRRTK